VTLARLAVLALLLCLAMTAPTVAATAATDPPPMAKAAACPGSIELGGQRYAYY